uniref:mucin-2-like isoform X1 n=1 Tax=Podarcis muralis TaxID=64176 RepID=UPI0010A0C074|nr:mucin-2-like isoform X1 [Podarcis muralis]
MKVFQSMLLGVLLALSLTGAQEVKQPPAKECKTRWFDRDNPSGTGDYELLSQFWDENPHIICPQPLAIEVQTVDGIPASETGQKFSVNDATSGFACINAQQEKGKACRDYQVRFTCPEAYCPTASSPSATLTPETLPPAQTFHPEPEPTPSAEGQKGVPSPQAPLGPETTLPPVQTPQPGPEQTTSAESQKGAPNPQAPLRPETTLPPVQTPHLGPEQTTILKEAPTPQAPLRPETTLPPAQTPHPGPEQTTILKGEPTPQVPLRPESTFPPAQTPHPGPEQTTILKGAPTPQVPLRPETTLPPVQTPHPGPEQTTILKKAPTPQVPLRPETTLPPAQTPHPGPQQTTILKGEPTPQVPLRPETTLPPVQTPHPGPEQTTILKGAPTPQVPLRPETTLPPVQTPHPGPEQTTILKGEPTPQVPLRPETTFPPAQTPHLGPEQTTSAEGQKGAPTAQAQLGPETSFPPAQTPQPGPEETTSAESKKGVCNTRWFDEDDPSGTGDYEFFFDILDKYPNDICSEPTAIEVQTLDGTPASETGQIFTTNDARTGFSCIHASQGKGKRCHDYQVRFTCPLSFCSGGEIRSTPGPEPVTPPAPTPTLKQVESSPEIPVKGGEIPSTPGPEAVTSPAPTPTLEEIKGSPKIPVKESPSTCKTRWFNEDNPSGDGDQELLFNLIQMHPQEICRMPLAIEVQTVDGIPALEAGQPIAVHDVITGFSCINAEQAKGQLCYDYRVRFTCSAPFCSSEIPPTLGPEPVTPPAPTPTLKQVESSPEIPVKGGEILSTPGPELVTSPAPTPILEEIKGSPKIPIKGGEIQSTPAPEPVTPPAPTPTLEQVQSSPNIPTKAINHFSTGDQNQPGAGLEPVTLLAPTAVSPEVKTGSQVQEEACKTNWFDRDNPSGTGDYELLSDIMDENEIDAICLDPIAIEVQTVDGIPASETGQQFAVNDSARGFACVNAHQGKGVMCLDYQVRFTCPDAFCAGKGQPGVESTSVATAAPVPATQETNQFPTQGQDQSGLTPAASTPVDSLPVQTTTANAPIETVPVQTTPQSPAPVCKTKWLNRDNPSATGDYELIYYLKKDYPKAICNKPIAIEVQTVDGIPASQTGQIFSRNDAVNGFACINAQQGKRGVCHDYKVRFTCPDSFCSGNDQKGVKEESP